MNEAERNLAQVLLAQVEAFGQGNPDTLVVLRYAIDRLPDQETRERAHRFLTALNEVAVMVAIATKPPAVVSEPTTGEAEEATVEAAHPTGIAPADGAAFGEDCRATLAFHGHVFRCDLGHPHPNEREAHYTNGMMWRDGEDGATAHDPAGV